MIAPAGFEKLESKYWYRSVMTAPPGVDVNIMVIESQGWELAGMCFGGMYPAGGPGSKIMQHGPQPMIALIMMTFRFPRVAEASEPQMVTADNTPQG